MKVPVVLLILDGWGIAPKSQGNAITQANTPHYDSFLNTYPHTHLLASGESVGLPHNEVGNTETGHLNMGAGHIVYQDLPRINMSIADGSFFNNQTFIDAVEHTTTNKSNLHIMGLIGAGGVHASNEHLLALITLCKEKNISNVYLHLFTDGRDSPPTVALHYIKRMQEELKRVKFGMVASIMGRYYAMDRDERWERTALAYNALVYGKAEVFASADEIIRQSYDKGITDEFIKPSLIKDANGNIATIADNDAVIFYNYRIDRPRQLTKAFVYANLDDELDKVNIFDSAPMKIVRKQITKIVGRGSRFDRKEMLKNLFFVTMTEYDKNIPAHVAFPPVPISNPIGRVVADVGLRQLRLAESEKERFVTFYFNGQREMPYVGEDRAIIDSLSVATYDLAPQMKTREITNKLNKSLKENIYDMYIVNIAASDMVGHTGILSAGIRAIEIIDECLGVLEETIISTQGACMFITADHGNCEEMIDLKTKGANTEHSNNPVPFIAVSKEFKENPLQLSPGILADISPTILSYMGIEIPLEMSGKNLLSH